MDTNRAVCELIRVNGPDQRYATCTGFLNEVPEHRLSTDDMAQRAMSEQGQRLQTLSIAHAGGKAWLVQGSIVVLRPTPEYTRMTRVGIEAPYVWRFDENNLLDQVDEICLGDGLRIVACRQSDGRWSASFVDRMSVERERRRSTDASVAASLEEALWGAVRTYRRQPFPQGA